MVFYQLAMRNCLAGAMCRCEHGVLASVDMASCCRGHSAILLRIRRRYHCGHDVMLLRTQKIVSDSDASVCFATQHTYRWFLNSNMQLA